MQAPITTRTPLAAATDNQLNTTPITSKKRKRNDDEASPANSIDIVGKAYHAGTVPPTATFRPIVTLARADLPLIWLDPISSADLPASGFLFEAFGGVLQILAAKQVMIARVRSNGRLYVLERAQDAVYTALLLRNWVTEDQCRSVAIGESVAISLDNLRPNEPMSNENIHGGHHRKGSVSSVASTVFPGAGSMMQPKNRKGAIARKAILTPREAREDSTTTQGADIETVPCAETPVALDNASSDMSVEAPLNTSPENEETPSLSSAALIPQPETEPHPNVVEMIVPDLDPKDELRLQYLDTLYTRTPLAFYAKGSLTRARAACKGSPAVFTSQALKDVYNSMVLPPKKMTLKYKESVPVFLKYLSVPADETQKQKKKSQKTIKLGKDGFYTGEYELLQKWWDDRATAAHGTSGDAQLRRHAEELRNRETEMQLLLILEVMIIDSIHEPAQGGGGTADVVIKVESIEKAEIEETKKRRKQRDFTIELDALLDSLCIYHTVTIDDFLISPEKASSSTDVTGLRSKDKLKEFCANIIVPFYASKLPKQVEHICEKLGGPKISSSKPKLERPKPTAGKASAPSSAKSTSAGKTSLQRVLSQDQDLRHSSPPILPRSSSGHQRSGSVFKREPSEIMSRPASRAGLQKSASFNNREIDLDADAKMQESKRRKLERVADQKKELAAAIEALKKPNRSSMSRLIMDEVEKRNEFKQQIQIIATPRKPSSSSISRPSSKKRAVLSAIHDTPSRDVHDRKSDPLNLKFPSQSSSTRPDTLPLASTTTIIASTPSTSRLRPDLPPPTETPRMSKSGKPVLFTPLKRTDVSIVDAFRDAPEIPEQAGKAMDRVMGGKARGIMQAEVEVPELKKRQQQQDLSLYAQLGWEDDDVDDF